MREFCVYTCLHDISFASFEFLFDRLEIVASRLVLSQIFVISQHNTSCVQTVFLYSLYAQIFELSTTCGVCFDIVLELESYDTMSEFEDTSSGTFES